MRIKGLVVVLLKVAFILKLTPSYSQEQIDTSAIIALLMQMDSVETVSTEMAIDLGDSAILLASKINDQERILQALDKTGWLHEKHGDYAQSLEYYHRGLNVSESINNSSSKARFLNYIGLVHHSQHNNRIATEYFEKCATLYSTIADTSGLIKANLNYSEANRHLGNYPSALDAIYDGIQLAEKSHDTINLAKLYNNLGSVHLMLDDHSKAQHSFQMAISLYGASEDSANLLKSINNLGITFRRNENFDSALVCYQQCLKIHEARGDSVELARTYNNLGVVYEENGDSNQAAEYYQLVIDIATNIRDSFHIAKGNLNMGDIQSSKGQLEDALISYKKANQFLKSRINLKMQADVNKRLQTTYYDLGNTDSAYYYLNSYQLITDSLYSAENANELANLQSQFATRQKEEQIKLLQKELEVQQLESTQRRMVYILGGSLIILILSLALGMVLIRRRSELRKARQQQEIFEAQAIIRKEIAEDLHEDVVNMLALTEAGLKGLGSVLKELNGKFKPKYDRLVSMIRKATMRVRDYSHTLNSEVLWEQGLEIALLEVLDRLDSNTPMDVDFDFINIEEELPYKTRLSIYRIVMECVNNVLRHAKATELYVKLIREGKTLSILVRDNGIGFEEGSKGIGIGLDNIHKRIGMLEGEYQIDSEPGKGTTVNITMDVYREN